MKDPGVPGEPRFWACWGGLLRHCSAEANQEFQKDLGSTTNLPAKKKFDPEQQRTLACASFLNNLPQSRPEHLAKSFIAHMLYKIEKKAKVRLRLSIVTVWQFWHFWQFLVARSRL